MLSAIREANDEKVIPARAKTTKTALRAATTRARSKEVEEAEVEWFTKGFPASSRIDSIESFR